jgi:hypothetical protein
MGAGMINLGRVIWVALVVLLVWVRPVVWGTAIGKWSSNRANHALQVASTLRGGGRRSWREGHAL